MKAPPFTLTSHTGQTLSLSDYAGKQVVLFFVRTPECYGCRGHVDHLARLYPQIRAANAEVLVIIHADVDTARAYAESLKTPFPVLADPEHSVYKEYGLNFVLLLHTRSASVVVSPAGDITYFKGAVAAMNWSNEAQAVLQQVGRGGGGTIGG